MGRTAREIARRPRRASQDAAHVCSWGLQRADDVGLDEPVATEERIVVSQDNDFGTPLALATRTRPCIILLMPHDGAIGRGAGVGIVGET